MCTIDAVSAAREVTEPRPGASGAGSCIRRILASSRPAWPAGKPRHRADRCSPSSRRQRSRCGFHQRVQHRVEIERRAADRLQHLGRRGLLLQRLGHVAVARLHLLEQPDILDGDDRLVGEGLEQVDLLVVNGLTSVRRMTIAPMASSFAQQRAWPGSSGSPSVCAIDWPTGNSSPASKEVVHVHRHAITKARPVTQSRGDRQCSEVDRDRPVMRLRWPAYRPAARKMIASIRVAELGGAFGDGFENRLDIGRRRGDHPQDRARRGLLLQRFVTSPVARLRPRRKAGRSRSR